MKDKIGSTTSCASRSLFHILFLSFTHPSHTLCFTSPWLVTSHALIIPSKGQQMQRAKNGNLVFFYRCKCNRKSRVVAKVASTTALNYCRRVCVRQTEKRNTLNSKLHLIIVGEWSETGRVEREVENVKCFTLFVCGQRFWERSSIMWLSIKS